MSQRRGAVGEEKLASIQMVEEGELTLDDGGGVGGGAGAGADNETSELMTPLALAVDVEGQDEYSRDRYAAKVKQWKESPFAVGLTDATWHSSAASSASTSASPVAGMMQAEIDPDSAGCLCCSRLCCRRAGRVGNMAILHQTTEWVEETLPPESDEQTPKARRYTRPKLVWMLGPYWPMLLFVTYPLILGVSGWTLVTVIPRVPFFIQFFWTVSTLGLIYALAMTAFRDPGILYRHERAPEPTWRWNDAALTYRPRNAFYDPDCAVVVEEFDHTCPWTGTAIGKRNMLAFQFFVGLVFLCLIMDIVLLSGAFAFVGN